jgi:hypothetical protein
MKLNEKIRKEDEECIALVEISQSPNASKAARDERLASIMMMVSQVFDDGHRYWIEAI